MEQATTIEINAKQQLRQNLEERLIEFGVNVLKLSEKISNTRAGNHIAGQLVRCGTSPAFNYGEAQSAESKNDFIHKMKISLKELRETLVCLKIIYKKPLVDNLDELSTLMKENNELISIFVKSVNTASSNK